MDAGRSGVSLRSDPGWILADWTVVVAAGQREFTRSLGGQLVRMAGLGGSG